MSGSDGETGTRWGLEGGRDRIPQQVLGRAGELLPSSTKGSVGEYGLRAGLCWTVLRDTSTAL